ncbi:hypothetical protein, partial [Nocardioides bruguierae]
LFPGVESALDRLQTDVPAVTSFVSDLAATLGRLADDAAAALVGDDMEAFISYVRSDTVPMMDSWARSTGNVVVGLGQLMAGLAPLSRDFTFGFEDMTRAFADWATELTATDGYRDFIEYVRDTGPDVLDLLGTTASTLISVGRAASPVGEALLPVLTQFVELVGQIADSPIGGPLLAGTAALMAFGRAADIASGFAARFETRTEAVTSAARTMTRTLAAGAGLSLFIAGIQEAD